MHYKKGARKVIDAQQLFELSTVLNGRVESDQRRFHRLDILFCCIDQHQWMSWNFPHDALVKHFGIDVLIG